MATVREVYDYIDNLASFKTQEGFDNAGLLVGRADREVTDVLVALDITTPVIEEAVHMGAQLIVSHHPVIFYPMKSVVDTDVTGQKVLRLAESGIAAICAHTNLDASCGGVNDLLAQAVGLIDTELLNQSGVDEQGRPYGIGRIGRLDSKDPIAVKDFAERVKCALHAACVRYMDAGKPVHRVAVGGGSCGSMLRDVAAAGCDTFLTADVKHDVFLDAQELGINLLDAGHFATEDVVIEPLVHALRVRFPELKICKSAVQREVFCALS